ncbi:MAG: GntR family transcriptional regulator [Desulfitobacteriaceae bacterium]
MSSMQHVRKVRKSSAVIETLEIMRDFIASLVQNGEQWLPSEEELANRLGISRLTVREALTVLEREGVVARFQGRGTMINHFAQRLTSRIDFAREIGKFIQEAGYEFTVDEVSHEWRLSNSVEDAKLALDDEQELMVVEKRFLADGNPAAFCIDRIPKKLFKSLDFSSEDLFQSMFAFVEKYCRCSLTHDVIEIIPVAADEKLARLLKVNVGTPLIRIDAVEYAAEETPVMYNTEFHVDQFCRFTLCRSVAYMS